MRLARRDHRRCAGIEMPGNRRVKLAKPKWLTVALRALLEAGIVAGFAYWGYATGTGIAAKIVLAIGVPLLGFGV